MSRLLSIIQKGRRDNLEAGYESELYLSEKALTILANEVGVPIMESVLGMPINYLLKGDIDVRKIPKPYKLNISYS